MAGWMSDRERAHVASLRTAVRRRSWTLGRWAAKQAVLASGLGASAPDPIRWSVLPAQDGAPEILLDGVPVHVSLSLSHRGGRALAVLAPSPLVVGCDLERLEPRSEAFIDDYLLPPEHAFVRAVEGARRHFRANLVWCGKEAALKVARAGLTRDTRSVEVHVAVPDGDPAERAWHGLRIRDLESGLALRGWWQIRDGFLEVIALPGPPND